MLHMKKENVLKSLLGLSQEETAMLLCITRVQWAQYTTGRRDIPLEAKQKLAEVLTFLENNKKSTTKVLKITETENKKAKEGLAKELKALTHKILDLENKISKIKAVRAAAFNALEVAHFLELQEKAHPITRLPQFIEIRVKNTLKKNSLLQLQEWQLKKESLLIAKSNLEKKLKNIL